jgi:hypothetical protein
MIKTVQINFVRKLCLPAVFTMLGATPLKFARSKHGECLSEKQGDQHSHCFSKKNKGECLQAVENNGHGGAKTTVAGRLHSAFRPNQTGPSSVQERLLRQVVSHASTFVPGATAAPFTSPPNSNFLHSLSITSILGYMHEAVNVCKKNN